MIALAAQLLPTRHSRAVPVAPSEAPTKVPTSTSAAAVKSAPVVDARSVDVVLDLLLPREKPRVMPMMMTCTGCQLKKTRRLPRGAAAGASLTLGPWLASTPLPSRLPFLLALPPLLVREEVKRAHGVLFCVIVLEAGLVHPPVPMPEALLRKAAMPLGKLRRCWLCRCTAHLGLPRASETTIRSGCLLASSMTCRSRSLKSAAVSNAASMTLMRRSRSSACVHVACATSMESTARLGRSASSTTCTSATDPPVRT
mmetsp:Transcript_2744/g.8176  ORF Transcript_2744/g.8176 Transcript_2744/m.8176 type:complete len:256 (-) Transcript_2744:661-1428(-)